MKPVFTCIVVAALLAACNPVKNIYSTDDISDRQLEKLVKIYLKNPADTASANRVLYAYHLILKDHLEKIENLKQSNSLQSMEALIYAYNELQAFYNEANQYPEISSLVKPGNVQEEKQVAMQAAAAGWYEQGNYLLAKNNWQSGREALAVYQKINGWIPGYLDSKSLAEDAKELATIDAVIQPLRAEGFFYSSQYHRAANRFTMQLVNDLSNGWDKQELYRVYNGNDAIYNDVQADWMIEPVVTRMQVDPMNYSHTTRTVTKKIEVGKDSLKNPVYKTISAVLSITEASVCASAEMEIRISDIQNQSRVGRRSFNENLALREVTATYKGDKDALSNEDWKLVNNRNQLRVDERWMQEKLMEKIYPDLLNYTRRMLR